MCGINGIIDKQKTPHFSEIKQMNNAISHRGPDGEGILKFENCILGHRRLSIQDLSDKGHQPMSVDGRYWIIFNGEIYNFKIIKGELENLGYTFFSASDTEVILNAYKEWGTNCFPKFNGMWALCILDKQTKTLLFSRDRYGVKPFYYYLNTNRLIFSSEIKGIFSSNENLLIDPTKAFADPKELEGNFSTIYKNVKILPPGTNFWINLENFKIKKKRWWIGFNNTPSISPNIRNIQNDIKERLFNACKLRLISDADIAVSLSGGVDSSIIFSILNNLDKTNNLNLNPFVSKKENITFQNALNISKKI